MRRLVAALTIVAVMLSACGAPDDPSAGASPPGPASPTAAAALTAAPSPTSAASPEVSQTPPTGIVLPTQEPTSGGMEALLSGTIVLRDGCLRVVSTDDDRGYLVVWPYRFSVELRDGRATVIDPHGTVVGVEGQSIELSGGDIGGTGKDVGVACEGPLWQTGATYPLGEGPQPNPEPEPPPMAVALHPAPDATAITGILTLDGDCLRITTPDDTSRLVIWPPGVRPHFEIGAFTVARADGAIVGWPGSETYLTGTPVDTLADVERLTALAEPVPEGCGGPYWVGGTTLDLAEFAERDGTPAELPRDTWNDNYIWSAAVQRITLRESIRRARLEEPLGPLNAALTAEQAETFGGVWIEREPEHPAFRIVFAFTRDGAATLAPYIAGTALDGSPDVEVRPVRWSERELRAQQQEASELLARIGINASSATMVQDSRIEVYVPWVEVAEQALADAGLTLPEAVVLIGVSDLPPPTPAS